MLEILSAASVTHVKPVVSTALPKEERQITHIFKRVRILHGLRFVLMERNGGALLSAVQLEPTVKSPVYAGRQKFGSAIRPLRVIVNFLSSPTAAVIESALLMLLIGWIDYKTTDFAISLFYFAPVVLASWRAGRKARWLLRHFAGRQF